jgi:hypothetical protein
VVDYVIAEDLRGKVELTLHSVVGWKLQRLHFVYALASVFSLAGHVVDFDWEIWNERVQSFQISDELKFERHQIGSLAAHLGPVWILAKYQTLTDLHLNIANSNTLSGADHSFIQLPYEVADQKSDDERTLGAPAEPGTVLVRTSKVIPCEPCHADNLSIAFQLSIPVNKLWALWNTTINLVEQDQYLVDEENANPEIPTKGPRPRIESLVVGSGVILPVDPSLIKYFTSSGGSEIVCRWFNLCTNEYGDMRTAADVVVEEDVENVELFDCFTLLII